MRRTMRRPLTPLAIGLALLVGAGALADPADEAPAAEARPGLTRIDEGPFRLSLPGSWRALPNEDVGFWSFRRDDDLAQVSVTVAFATREVPRTELDDVFLRFSQSRRDSMREQAPECETSKPVSREHLEAIAGSYRARCTESGRWKGDFLVVRTDLVASFLLETHRLDEAAFVELFDQVRAGAELARPR